MLQLLYARNREYHGCVSLCVGGDAGQVWKLRVHATTILGLRRFDVDPALNAQRCAWGVLLVLAGPSEPPAFDSILAPTIQFFSDHDIGRVAQQCNVLGMPGSLW
jgi:hypothetical protein